MNRITVVSTLAILTLTAACAREPKLDVRESPAEPAAAQPAPAPAGDPAAVQPAHPPVAGAPASSELPAGHPPLAGAPMAGGFEVAPVDPGTGQGAAALAWTEPAGWVSEAPSNSMRRAQYKVPGPGGDAECVVFYFGPGQGGDARSNAERWASQFVPAGGGDPIAAMRTRSLDVAGRSVLVVETEGTYQAGSMMGGPVTEKPGYALLGAVAEGPDANWFFKLTGPKATVEAARAPFEEMVRSLRQGG